MVNYILHRCFGVSLIDGYRSCYCHYYVSLRYMSYHHYVNRHYMSYCYRYTMSCYCYMSYCYYANCSMMMMSLSSCLMTMTSYV